MADFLSENSGFLDALSQQQSADSGKENGFLSHPVSSKNDVSSMSMEKLANEISAIDDQDKLSITQSITHLQDTGSISIVSNANTTIETNSFVTGPSSVASESGPTIRLISYNILKELDEFPRCPDDNLLISDFKNVDWKNSFIVFISHCWLRGGPDCSEWEGFPHPDNRKHEKFQFCLDAVHRLWQSLAPSMEDCFVWMDFASLNQNAANPGLELEHLDGIMEVCDCVLTPIVDNEWEKWSLHLKGNLFVDYRAKSWQKGPLCYLNRAWCRMEMLYAATIPLRRESRPGGSRYLKFQGALKTASNQNRRPHFLYGSREFYESKQLLTLPPLRNSYFHDFNPAEGVVRYEADRAKIASLMAELEKYRTHSTSGDDSTVMHSSTSVSSIHSSISTSSTVHAPSLHAATSSAAVGGSSDEHSRYVGAFDDEGRYHGYGSLTYDNGDHYEGFFNHGLRDDYGVLAYANGDQYRGNFHYDKREGRGVMVYGNGNRYVGSFHHGYRNGPGILTYADGSLYDGTFVYGYQAGLGRFYEANGDIYEGEMAQDLWHGNGKWTRFSCGDIILGRFYKGKPVEGEFKKKPLI